jgi:hypothetical protein
MRKRRWHNPGCTTAADATVIVVVEAANEVPQCRGDGFGGSPGDEADGLPYSAGTANDGWTPALYTVCKSERS